MPDLETVATLITVRIAPKGGTSAYAEKGWQNKSQDHYLLRSTQ